MQRSITINLQTFPLTEKQWQELIKQNLAYECGEEHDLHLIPDVEWSLESGERLCVILLSKE